MKVCIILLISVAGLASCNTKREKETPGHYNSFRSISRLFTNPPSEFRSVPLWVWNGKVTREMIDEQLAG